MEELSPVSPQPTIIKNKYKKYLIIILPLTIAIIVVFLAISYFRNKESDKNNSIAPTITITPKSQNLPSTTKWSEPVSSPKRDLNLRYKIEEIEDKYKIDIILSGYKKRLIVTENSNEVELGVIWSTTGNKEQLGTYLTTKRNMFAWSPSDNQFTLLTPDKVIVYNYYSNPVPNDTWSPPRVNVKLTKTNEFLIDSNIDKFDIRSILFSGDGKELYYSSNKGIRVLLPEENVFDTQPGYYTQQIYQIPGTSGIAYWISDEEVSDFNKHSFILDYGNGVEKYTVTSSFGIDYKNEIILSPNIRKACIGWGSSGSRGRLLFNLVNGEQLNEGSGCLEWVDNNKVVLYETDSSGGGENGYLHYYLYDFVSNKRTFLHDYYNGL